MSSGTYRQVNARCPFFKWMEGKAVACEGIVDDSSIVQKFRYASDWDIHTRTFCCDRFQNCEIYQMLMDAKYGGDAG